MIKIFKTNLKIVHRLLIFILTEPLFYGHNMYYLLFFVCIDYLFIGKYMEIGKFVLHHTKQKKAYGIYTYYMIAWYYRKDNKPFRHVLKNLGHLNNDEIEYYRNAIACLNQEPQVYPCHLETLSVRVSHDYLGCALALHFWDHWQLSAVFKEPLNRKDVSTGDVARILTALRFVKPGSQKSSVELYADTCLPQLTGVSTQAYNTVRISRELTAIETRRENLGRHIFQLAKQRGDTQGQVLFYDLSSGNLSGLRCVMAKWGHCKDGNLRHVVLLLVITPEGYPIYWEVLPGNTADATTIEGLIEKVEKLYGHIDSVICFDRGMVSDDNLKLLNDKGIRFITALDGSQLHHFQESIDFDLLTRVKTYAAGTAAGDGQIKRTFTDAGFECAQKDLFTKSLQMSAAQKEQIEKQTTKLDLSQRRYFLAFNPILADLTHQHRQERVADFVEWVGQYNQELKQALGSRDQATVEKTIQAQLKKKKIADVKLSYTISAYQVKNRNKKDQLKTATTYHIDLDPVTDCAYVQACRFDGLWVLITNISAKDESHFFKQTQFNSYFEIYRLKHHIEEAFRILSDVVGVEPFYVYLEEHVQAHFTLCVLTYLLNITVINKIRNSTQIENMGMHRVTDQLKKCRQDYIQMDQHTMITKLTQLNEKQKKLLEVLECEYLVSPEYVKAKNIVSVPQNCKSCIDYF